MTEKSNNSSVNQQDELRVDLLKRMCRLLEIKRRQFLDDAWKRHYAKFVTQQQFVHLMAVRFSLPCNLAKIMKITGLTSAGASIFVDKMVKGGVFLRIDNPDDRRNVIINFTPKIKEAISNLDNRLNRFVYSFFAGCSEKELLDLENSCRLVCEILEKKNNF